MKKILLLSLFLLSQLYPSSDSFAFLPKTKIGPLTSFPSYMKQRDFLCINMLNEALPHAAANKKTELLKKITKAKNYVKALDEKAAKILCRSEKPIEIINSITFGDICAIQGQMDSLPKDFMRISIHIMALLNALKLAIKEGIHPIKAAIQAHLAFVMISPSKRTAQILFNIVLMAFGYMPLNFPEEKRYLNALKETFSGADPAAFERYCIAELQRVMTIENTTRASHNFVRKAWSV